MARNTKETKSKAPQLDSHQAIELEQTRDNNLMSEENSGAYNQRSRCGGALRTARESQGLSIQDIASRLRLGPKQIDALESDNFAILPEATIIRGFIRNYAKQLKINAEPLLDAYNVLVPHSDLHRPIVQPNANMKMTSYKKPKIGRYLFVFISALLGLGVWYFYQNYVAKPVATPFAKSDSELSVGAIGDTIGESTSNETTLPLPEAALPAAERESSLQTSTELSLPAAPEAATTLSPADANAGNTATTATLPAPALASSLPTLPAPTLPNLPSSAATLPATDAPLNSADSVISNTSSTTKLEFNATQETWIQVRDASGRQIFNKIIFAGSRQNVDVTPPVNITVGNAGATSLSMNGKPVDLAPHSHQNVARIKLE